MDFLGIGPLELAFILIIIFIVIGPKDINKTARSAGRFLNRMYKSEEWRALTQASQTIRTLPNRLAREAELEELKDLTEIEEIEEIKETISSTKNAVRRETRAFNEQAKGIDKEMRAWSVPGLQKTGHPPKPSTEPSDEEKAEAQTIQPATEGEQGAAPEPEATPDTTESPQESE